MTGLRLRNALALAAVLAASACGYGSAVDIAPMSVRLDRPVLAPGDYCEVEGLVAPFRIISSEDCVPVSWTAASWTLSIPIDDDPTETVQAGVVALGSDLYAAQIDSKESGKIDGPGNAKVRYQIHLIVTHGDAFIAAPTLTDDQIETLARKHPRVTIHSERGHPFIAAGEAGRIKAFLKDAAREGFRTAARDDDETTVGVRDAAGAEDHPASAAQTRDIVAVLKAAKKLTPK